MTTTPAAPAHGDRRNRRWVWHEDEPRTYITADTGEPITVRGGGSGEDREEYYCAVHGWVDYGFLGGMLFPAQHDGCADGSRA